MKRYSLTLLLVCLPLMACTSIRPRNEATATMVPEPLPRSSANPEILPDGVIRSPFPPFGLVDVKGIDSGTIVIDPHSRKLIRVP